MVTWTGPTQEIEASGVLHPPSWLLPSLPKPTSVSTLARGGVGGWGWGWGQAPDSDQCAHTCAHAPSPLLGTLRVPRMTDQSKAHVPPPSLAANWSPGRRRSASTSRLYRSCGQLSLVTYYIPVTILITLPPALEGSPLISPVCHLRSRSRVSGKVGSRTVGPLSGDRSGVRTPEHVRGRFVPVRTWCTPGSALRGLPPRRTRTATPLPPSCPSPRCLGLLPRTLRTRWPR